MHPALSAYLESEVARSAHYNEQTQSFHYTKHGRPIQCGGIHGWLRTLFYSHYVRNRSDRNHKQVSLIGSTHTQGKLVDAQLEAITRGKMSMTHRKMHKMTRAIVEWLHARGHTLEAAQVPVELAQGWGRMTCADLITRNKADGKLWVWEIKTGFPVGFYRSQGNFANAPLEDVPCTQQNIWFLQLHYTHQALCTMARLPIEGGCSRILQVYLKKQGRGKPAALIVEEHAPPAWLTARVPLMAPPPLGLGVPVSKKKRPAPSGPQEAE
jgi:hypothetical protein